ncbi:MAG TPA: S8 family serine peptidase [Saprospiraceae bacterium]|nr:S8 family serine peptidase [Saprospiraceae bacterium]HPI06529.1 S8 family serine peptidase [Saprospiraceae bacterium]
MSSNIQQHGRKVTPVIPPLPVEDGELGVLLAEASSFINAPEARRRYGVSGANRTVAVLDTGLRTTHVDFAGKVLAQQNFTSDNGGNSNNAGDGHGHGTNVGGIIVANGVNHGIAPGGNIVPLKVLTNTGQGSFTNIGNALEWVLKNYKKYKISVVSMSLGDSGNYTTDEPFATDEICKKIVRLHDLGIAVTIAAGNSFFTADSRQGMGFPAIIRQCISVGAVYDANEGGFTYGDGARAFTTTAGQITPFSQRLHEGTGGVCRTDIFAPGAPITSSGIANDRALSVQQGTSQATPVVAGVIMLMQELYGKLRSQVPKGSKLPVTPPVKLLAEWLRQGAVNIIDGDDEDDNVAHSNLKFKRIDAYQALRQVRKHFVKHLAFPGE